MVAFFRFYAKDGLLTPIYVRFALLELDKISLLEGVCESTYP